MLSHEIDHFIPSYESDAFGRWRPDHIFRVLQEVGGAHSEILSVDRDTIIDSIGCVWMLARVALEVRECPSMFDTVHIKTWHGNANRITYPRYFAVTNSQGEEIVWLTTSWVLVDTDTRRMVLPNKAKLTFPAALEIEPKLSEPNKPRIDRSSECREFFRETLYCDVDINHHMNNASYISWLMDVYPFSWHENHLIKSLTVGYSSESKPNEGAKLLLYENGLQFGFEIISESDDRVIFEAEGEWISAPRCKPGSDN